MSHPRNDAAAKVNDAVRAAKVTEVANDPKAKGFSVEIDGEVAHFSFGHVDIHRRRDEIAHWRLALVEEILKKAPALLKAKAPEAPAPVDSGVKA